tara:strand:- start:17 stop:286 length:270 start_codon:yes stop_codon:yes gene_type:complete
MINYNIIVKGKVQGVWFRKYTQDIAYNLNLNGFVRNCHDGSVFIEIEGKEDKIKVFMDKIRIGPHRAEVIDIICNTGELKSFSKFEISY